MLAGLPDRERVKRDTVNIYRSGTNLGGPLNQYHQQQQQQQQPSR
jgi:hypothetical protein